MKDSSLWAEARIRVERLISAALFSLFVLSVLHPPQAIFLPCSPRLGEHKMLPRIHPACLIQTDKSCLNRADVKCFKDACKCFSNRIHPA